MGDFLREGGWPMWPVLALGGSALVLSLRYAAFPQRSLRSLVIGLLVASVVMGVLGTILGLQRSIEGCRELPPNMGLLFLVGLKESLQCTAGALVLALPTALALGAGSHRTGRRLEEIGARTSA
jgi:hypothetical protein